MRKANSAKYSSQGMHIDKTVPAQVVILPDFSALFEVRQAFILQHSAEKSIRNSADAKHDNCDQTGILFHSFTP